MMANCVCSRCGRKMDCTAEELCDICEMDARIALENAESSGEESQPAPADVGQEEMP